MLALTSGGVHQSPLPSGCLLSVPLVVMFSKAAGDVLVHLASH